MYKIKKNKSSKSLLSCYPVKKKRFNSYFTPRDQLLRRSIFLIPLKTFQVGTLSIYC